MTSPGPPSRRPTAALAALALLAAGAACGNGDDSAGRRLLELRPVLAETPPPCPAEAPDGGSVLPMLTDGTVTECLELGPPIVDARDVRSATVAETPSTEPALSVVLGGTGSANLDGFAARSYGKRLAIVADGDLVSAPVIRFASFAGRIQISGLSKEKTEDLFRRLNELIRSG